MITENPLTWSSYDLSPSSKDVAKTIKLFQKSLSNWASQMQQTLTNPAVLASVLNSSYGLRQSDSFVHVLSTPTSNQTVDTQKSQLVFINYGWSTASNFTATLNNVVDGQILMFRFFNGSGAARTVTVLANTPASTAITVATASSALSSGVSVGSGVTVAFYGLASAVDLRYFGTGQNW